MRKFLSLFLVFLSIFAVSCTPPTDTLPDYSPTHVGEQTPEPHFFPHAFTASAIKPLFLGIIKEAFND